jgi:hypothetical protein
MKAPAVVLDRGSLKLDIPVPVFVDDAVQVGLLYVQHVTLVHVMVALTLALMLRKVLARCFKVHAHVLRALSALAMHPSLSIPLNLFLHHDSSCPVAAPSLAASSPCMSAKILADMIFADMHSEEARAIPSDCKCGWQWQ